MENTTCMALYRDFFRPERKKDWTCQTLLNSFNPRAGITSCLPASCPKGGWPFRSVNPVMNKQPRLDQDQKGRWPRMKLHDLPPRKEQKGGCSAKSAASENGTSGIPTSLQEFLKRDSLAINS